MSELTPHFAPIVTLLFLATLLLTGLGVLLMLYAAVRRSSLLAEIATTATFLIASGYLLLVVGVSAVSKDKILPPGASKYFCELDCHLAYSVVGSYRTAVLGPELKQTAARGKFVVVQLKTRFDEKTISPRRGDGPLTPNRRGVVLVDDQGRRFGISTEGELALSKFGESPTPPLTQSLRPSESYVTDLVFDVPVETRGLRLLLTENYPETRLIIGHENSLFHGKIYLGLTSEKQTSLNFR